MKIFSNKKMLFKLIVSLCIFLTLISFGIPSRVQASWEFKLTKGAAEAGGKLLAPIIDFVLALADGVLDILHEAIMGTESAFSIDTTLATIIGLVFAVMAFAAIVGLGVIIGPFLAAIPLLGTIVAGTVGVLAFAGASFAYSGVKGDMLPDVTLLPSYSISPEEIFRGEILLFDVNIFNPKELYVKVEKDDSVVERTATQWNARDKDGKYTDSYRNSGYEVGNYYYYKDGNSSNKEENNIIVTSANNSAFELRSVVAKWYYAIRNIAIIGLMLVLVYVGIRIMISTTAAEKSKYKQFLGDWVIAMCLIFIMQYIMVFANNFTESLINLFSSVSENQYHVVKIEEADGRLIEGVKELGLEKMVKGEDILWKTDLMGKARIMAEEQNGTTGYIGYALCYLVLVIFTLVFTVTYAKRLLYIVFFTIISPLVALTYPIDKMNDGKAQAFNVWLREYIFNLLIQPFHLLLYTVLISTAFDLAGTNIIYTLVAIGFMIPAEKFLRKMFGFDKASTPGFLNGAAGAALAMNGLHSLQKIAGRGPGAKGKQENDSKDTGKIDFMDRGASSGYKTDNLLSNIGGKQGKTSTTQASPKTTMPKDNDENKTDAQKMFDADEENGKFDNDSEYRENMAREAYGPTPGGMYDGMSDNEYKEQLRDSGMDDETIAMAMAARNGGQEETRRDENVESPDVNTSSQTTSTPASMPTPTRIPKPTVGQYLGAKGRMFGRRLKDGYSRENMKDMYAKTFKGAIRTTGKIGGMVAGGMIGAASDIASGSFGKNVATGVVAGGAIGTGAANLATNAIDRSEKTHEETLKEIYGENYSEYIKQKKDDMFIRDHNMREMYSREFSTELSGLNRADKKKKLDNIMNAAVEYRKYGVKDNGTIMKAMKIDGGNENTWKDPERIAAARFAQSVKSEKDLDSVIKRYKETPGITATQAENMKKRIRRINNDIL